MSGLKTNTRGMIATAFMVLLIAALSAGCGSSGAGDGGDGGGGETAAGTTIDAGVPGITLMAPAMDEAGEVPIFEWEAVTGAARYRLVVLDGSGATLWAWNGAETKVNLGGLPGERPEGVGGPVIDAGSSWSVVAFDDNGSPLAASDIRPVSP